MDVKIVKSTNSIEGKLLTAGFVILGVAVAVKNYKKEGFWYGVGALMLMGTSVYISKGKSTS